MKIQLFKLRSVTMLIWIGLLTSCASTVGTDYPSNCCVYRYVACGNCSYKVIRTKCPKPCYRPCCEDAWMTTCCDYGYVFNCCDSRDYWCE